MLHPRYQAVTTRTFWEACKRKADKAAAGLEVHSIRATADYADSIKLPLLGVRKVRAVTLEIRFKPSPRRQP